MGRLRDYLLLLAISSALVASCHSSPESKLRQVHQQLASWDATAQLTHELSGRGALPSLYVRQVSEAVAQGREQAHQRASKISR